MFENVINFFKKIGKKEEKPISSNSKDAAKERLHLVLMQDRANVSADFLELMKQEIIEVIKKYIEVDENAIDVRLTNKENDDGTNGAPALYANIPIINIKNDARKVGQKEIEENGKNNNPKEKIETKEKEQEETEKKNENQKTNETKKDKNGQTNPENKEQKVKQENKDNTTQSTDKQEEKKQSGQKDEPKNTSKQETSKEEPAEEIKSAEETKQKEETNKPIKTKEKVKSEK